MDYSNVRLVFDIHEVRSSAVVRVKKGSNTLRLCISLTEGGKVYKLPKACEVTLKVKLPNGEKGLCKCNIEDNTIFCIINGGITNIVGVSECEIYVVTGDENVVYGPTFSIMVQDTLVDDDAPELKGDLDALSKMVAENVSFKSEIESKVNEVESAFNIYEGTNLLNPNTIERDLKHPNTSTNDGELGWGDGAGDSESSHYALTDYISVKYGDVLTYQRKNPATGEREIVDALWTKYGWTLQGDVNVLVELDGDLEDNTAWADVAYMRAWLPDNAESEEMAIVKNSSIIPYEPYVKHTHILRPECLPEGYIPEGGAGTSGEDGATFIPSMSEDGILSWTNDKGLANPPPVNVQGPKGEKGEKGDGADVVVDDALDSNSTNPVQNKAVAVPLDHLTSALNSVRSVASVAADEATEAKNSADFALNTANNIGSALSATINRVSTLETDVKELQENGCGGVDITDDGNGNVTITNSPKFEDMRAALDSIIAIQEALIGGGGE